MVVSIEKQKERIESNYDIILINSLDIQALQYDLEIIKQELDQLKQQVNQNQTDSDILMIRVNENRSNTALFGAELDYIGEVVEIITPIFKHEYGVDFEQLGDRE